MRFFFTDWLPGPGSGGAAAFGWRKKWLTDSYNFLYWKKLKGEAMKQIHKINRKGKRASFKAKGVLLKFKKVKSGFSAPRVTWQKFEKYVTKHQREA